MLNVGEYSIHGASGYGRAPFIPTRWRSPTTFDFGSRFHKNLPKKKVTSKKCQGNQWHFSCFRFLLDPSFIWMFPKIVVYPQIIHLNGGFHYKPSLLQKIVFVWTSRVQQRKQSELFTAQVWPVFFTAPKNERIHWNRYILRMLCCFLLWDQLVYIPLKINGWNLQNKGLVQMTFLFISRWFSGCLAVHFPGENPWKDGIFFLSKFRALSTRAPNKSC